MDTSHDAILTATTPALGILDTASDRAEWDRLCSEYRTASHAYRDAGNEYEKREEQAAKAVDVIAEPTKPITPALDMDRTLADIAADANSPEMRERWKLYDQARTARAIETAAIREDIVGDTEERWGAAMALHENAISALRHHPVTSLAMLREKADILSAEYSGMLDDGDAAALIADIRRLADREG